MSLSYQSNVTFEIDTPICPPQDFGWTCNVYRDLNTQWKIIASRGSRAEHNLTARHISRLSADEVRAFDIARYR